MAGTRSGNSVSVESAPARVPPRRLYRRRSVSENRIALEEVLATRWQFAGGWRVVADRSVARAADRATGEPVRIVAVFCDADGMATARLAREIGALERFAHQPAVVPLLDSGRADGWLFMVTPWYESSLRELIAQHGPRPPDVAMAHVIGVADLLHFAHGLGIAHGAVSSDTLFLSETALHLGEFVNVRHLRTSADRPAAAKRDVAGLARVLFEMLTGVPWSAKSVIPESLPEPLAHFLHRALGPARTLQFATAIAFAQALCCVREQLQHAESPVSGRDADDDEALEDLPLSDGAERSLRVLHALLDRAEVADVAPAANDPLVMHCWSRADAQVHAGDSRLVALQCRWRLLAERDPAGALRAAQRAPHAPAVLPYRARALAALGRAAEARTVAVRSWFDEVALDLSGVRSLVMALLLTRAFELASLVSIAEFANGVVDPVILAAGQTSVARGAVPRLTPAAQTRTLRAIASAIDRRVAWTAELLVDPRWDALRSDYRFAALLARAKSTWTT
jgi:hypothetical protein